MLQRLFYHYTTTTLRTTCLDIFLLLIFVFLCDCGACSGLALSPVHLSQLFRRSGLFDPLIPRISNLQEPREPHANTTFRDNPLSCWIDGRESETVEKSVRREGCEGGGTYSAPRISHTSLGRNQMAGCTSTHTMISHRARTKRRGTYFLLRSRRNGLWK